MKHKDGTSTNEVIEARRLRLAELRRQYFADHDRFPRPREIIELMNKDEKWGKYTWQMYNDDDLAVNKQSQYLANLHQADLSVIAEESIKGCQEFQRKAMDEGDGVLYARVTLALNQIMNGRLGDAAVVLMNAKIMDKDNALSEANKKIEELQAQLAKKKK